MIAAILCYLPDKGRTEVEEDSTGLAWGEWRWGDFTVKVKTLPADSAQLGAVPSGTTQSGSSQPGTAPVAAVTDCETTLHLELLMTGPAQAIWFDPAACRLERAGRPTSALVPSSVRLQAFAPAHLAEELALCGTLYGQGASRAYELKFKAGEGLQHRLRVPVYDQVFGLELRSLLACPETDELSARTEVRG